MEIRSVTLFTEPIRFPTSFNNLSKPRAMPFTSRCKPCGWRPHPFLIGCRIRRKSPRLVAAWQATGIDYIALGPVLQRHDALNGWTLCCISSPPMTLSLAVSKLPTNMAQSISSAVAPTARLVRQLSTNAPQWIRQFVRNGDSELSAQHAVFSGRVSCRWRTGVCNCHRIGRFGRHSIYRRDSLEQARNRLMALIEHEAESDQQRCGAFIGRIRPALPRHRLFIRPFPHRRQKHRRRT